MGILSTYRAIDLTDEKGMFAARLLGDMGAEVIRIEKPPAGFSRENFEFAYLNAGKKRISLDLESEKGRDVFRRLVKTTDFLVETYRPGYLESLGLGYQPLSEISPRLIMASLTAFGQSGPYRDFPSDNLVLEALGGWMSVTGEADRPLKLYGNQAYYIASLFAVNGLLLALRERHGSGKGQHLDISVMDCVAATLDHVIPRYTSEGITSGRQGSRHWNNAFRVFRCKDGYILLSLQQHWETLVELLDSEGMAGDLTGERWLEREERNREMDHIIEVLERWTLQHTVAELEEKGQLMHFPWAGVRFVSQLLKCQHLRTREYFTDIEVADSGQRYRAPGAAVKMSCSPWKAGGRVARPGEHNAEIYLRELGLPESDYKTFSEEGVT